MTENYSLILDVPFDQSFTYGHLGVFFFLFLLSVFLLLAGDRIFVSEYLELFVHYPFSYFIKP